MPFVPFRLWPLIVALVAWLATSANAQATETFAKKEDVECAVCHENPAGGGAAAGMGMGMGFGLAKQMVDTMSAGGAAAGNTAPPPVPQEIPWYVASEGHQTGPFTKAEIRNKLESGDVNRDTLVWRQGLEEWTAAERVDELAAIFAQLPPPVPKG